MLKEAGFTPFYGTSKDQVSGAMYLSYLGKLNNEHSLLTILEAGKSKIKVLAELVVVRTCFLAHRRHLLVVSAYIETRKGAL